MTDRKPLMRGKFDFEGSLWDGLNHRVDRSLLTRLLLVIYNSPVLTPFGPLGEKLHKAYKTW